MKDEHEWEAAGKNCSGKRKKFRIYPDQKISEESEYESEANRGNFCFCCGTGTGKIY